MLEKLRTSTPNIPHLAPYRHLLTVAAVLLVIGLAACSSISESGREGSGGESGEGPGHGEGGEGGEGSEGGEGGGEESRNPLLPGQTFDMTRKGARLVLRYDAAGQTFRGTVTNTTNAPLSRVRVEVHLAGGPELGPTKPTDLAPGETIMVSLDATGQNFSTWSPHAEVGPGSPVDPTGTSTFVPSLGEWAVVGGVDLGIEHKGHGLSAQHEWQGGAWTSSVSPDPAPQHQPTGAATWTGQWVGYHESDPAISSGAASVTVTLGAATKAALALQSVPILGTLQWDNMPVTGGRFMGSTTANFKNYDAVGQFGGANQAGVVGHATGSDFQSVFYGEKN